MVVLISRKFRFRKLRALGRRDDGTAAIEFAVVLPAFLAMLFAVLETALVFFAGQTLETAGTDSARLVLTGQYQTADKTQADFKNAVCARLAALFDCAALTVDVQKFNTFASVDLTRPVDAEG